MIEYPNIDPVAISIPISGFWGESINIYWYGLAYVVGSLSDLPTNAANKKQI